MQTNQILQPCVGICAAKAFGYNVRSEVTSAAMGTNSYGYAYDPIGNRLSASLNAATNTYAAHPLNQYTSLLCASAPLRYFQYDADGNMIADERGWRPAHTMILGDATGS